MSNQHLLYTAMACAIPLYILQFKEKGGPTEEDFQQTKKVSDMLGEHGDLLIYGGKPRNFTHDGITEKISTADIFNKTAKAIAVLSFCPGGVDIFGGHYEAKTFFEPKVVLKNVRCYPFVSKLQRVFASTMKRRENN